MEGSLWKTLNRHSWLGPLGAWVVLYIFFALMAPESFTTFDNLQIMVRQTTMVGIAALGMTMVIIVGGIDLSVGSTVALTTVVVARLLQAELSPFASALGGLMVAAAAGLIIGALITSLRMTPFIVTLGAMGILRGAAKGVAGEQKIDAPLTWLNELVTELPAISKWMLFPPGVWVLIGMALLVAGLLRYTRLGRHIFAIGSNEQTARLTGVRVRTVKVIVYTMCSAFAGLAGIMQFSRLTVGDPTVALGFELDVIAAVVIGGGSLSGGEGSVAGSIFGALLMTLIRSGCTHLGISNWVQEIITGMIIVIAVALDRLRQRS
jgi:ribose/xylose/arabinose/galactoside ABC-type transport system permease subunit